MPLWWSMGIFSYKQSDKLSEFISHQLSNQRTSHLYKSNDILVFTPTLVVLLRPVLVLFVTISSSFSPYVASLKNVQITKKLKLLTTFDWWLQDNFCGNFWRLSIFHVCDPIIFQIAKTIAFTQDCVAFCINIYLSFVIFHKVMRLRILYFELQNGDNLW